jgi:hypothetical protein
MLSSLRARRLDMYTFRRAFIIGALMVAAFLTGIGSAWAGGYRHHGPHHGYHAHSRFSFGLNYAYPPPYWRSHAYYPAYRPYYAPAYGPGWGGGAISLGYGSGGHHGSWGVGLTLPLSFGPRYAPPPAPVAVPSVPSTAQQGSGECLQVREYQTEIVIGGKTVPAYGDACLQPDGSWKQVTGPFAADY